MTRPEMIDISFLIDQKVEDTEDNSPRPHLGASEIGGDCPRKAWYSFHWAKKIKFEGRMLRLFARGHDEEITARKYLEAIGTVFESTQESKYILNGHFGGSNDGIIKRLHGGLSNEDMIFECKTHNRKSFVPLSKKGVKEAKHQHYVQMQIYMGLFEKEQALYYAVCKDDDQLHIEIVDFDQGLFSYSCALAKRIIESPEPLARISENQNKFPCSFCDYRDICFGLELPEVNCRTCVRSTPHSNATFHCDRYQANISSDRQYKSGQCPSHLYNPTILPWPVVDANNDNVTYSIDDVEVINKVKDSEYNGYTSQEMYKTDIALLSDDAFNSLKEDFNCEVVTDVTEVDK